MREIKFRARDIKRNKWLLFGDSELIRPDYCGINTLGYWCFTFDYDKDRVALMQYTGLKDKNGKEIYDEDILQTPGTEKLYVQWSGNGWNISGYESGQCEIIDNIWENPELLEDKS